MDEHSLCEPRENVGVYFKGTMNQMKQWSDPLTGKAYSVDAEIDDAVLLGLNRLVHFRLNSICFGHEDGSVFSRKAFPYILLTVSPAAAKDPAAISGIASLIRKEFLGFESFAFQEEPEPVLRLEGPPACHDPQRQHACTWFDDAVSILQRIDAQLTPSVRS